MIHVFRLTGVVLTSCAPGPGPVAIVESRADDVSTSPDAPPLSTPRQYFWELAPCGKEWYGWWQCSPEGKVFQCGLLDERGVNLWSMGGWPCECVDNDTGELLVGTPGCEWTK